MVAPTFSVSKSFKA